MNGPLERLRPWLAAATAAFSLAIAVSVSHAQQTPYTLTWLGNTYGGKNVTTIGGWPQHKHVQLAVEDMAVEADGTVYTNSTWDEGGNEAGIYRDDDIIGNCDNLSHSWGRDGSVAVTFDAHYIYALMHQNGDDGADQSLNDNHLHKYPDRGTDWLCVRRFHKDGKSAPFPTGYGIQSDCMIVTKSPRTKDGYPETVRGLAVWGTSLYVSEPGQNQIAVYDTTQLSGTPATAWPVDHPGKIALDGAGRLWVLHGETHPTVACLDASGHPLPMEITFSQTADPSAIAWDEAAGRLLIADRGIDQDIKFYDPRQLSGAPTRPAATLGTLGGIHSKIDGMVGPLRFFDPSGVGADAQGNIYVANNILTPFADDPQGSSMAGGAQSLGLSLESYQPNGAAHWAKPLQCLEFVNCDAADPQSDTDVYSTNMHYALDYSKPAGQGWTLKGVTLDRFKYPDDPRVHFPRFGSFRGGVWVRRINGVTYLFMTEQQGHMICVERLIQSADQDTAAPYALFSQRWLTPWASGWPAGQPGAAGKSTEWIWRDANGDGKMEAGEYATPADNPAADYDAGWGEWVDARGDVWQSGHGHIRHFKMHLDTRGRPVWDYAPGDVDVSGPPPLPDGAAWQHGGNPDDDDLARIEYQPATDTMYLAGFTSAYPDTSNGYWGVAGRVVYRYDHWSRGPAIHSGYPILLPWGSGTGSNFDGKPLIKSISVAGDYLFALQGQFPSATVTIYSLDTAAKVGEMSPNETVGTASGWNDATYAVRAHRRADGEYIVFTEEDLYEKALIYRWRPPGASLSAAAGPF